MRPVAAGEERTMPEIDKRVASLFVPDTLVASQYFDRVRRRRDLTGEQRLMWAVLQDAVDTYLANASASDTTRRARFLETERWLESEDRSRLFAFGSVCDHLGLDTGSLRRALRRSKHRARGLDVSAPGFPPTEHRRASNE